MLLDMMLPWFPIVLSAAIGARLVGPRKATWLGLTCALFWVIVVQTTTGVPFWADAVTLASLIAGSAAIVGMAHWSAVWEGQEESQKAKGERRKTNRDQGIRGLRDQGIEGSRDQDADFEAVVEAVGAFDDWLERHRCGSDPWPAFDEFLRGLLHEHCGAAHTRPYRLLSEGEGLLPLRAMDAHDREELLPAREGILGHVATSGRSFYAGDRSQGELVMALAESGGRGSCRAGEGSPRGLKPAAHGDGSPRGVRSATEPGGRSAAYCGPAWCFAIRSGGRTIGVVSVGQLGEVGATRARRKPLPDGRGAEEPLPSGSRLGRPQGRGSDWGPPSRSLLRAFEHLTTQFWITLGEVCRSRSAAMTDPVSMLMTREAFLDEARRAGDDSYGHGEPIAVVVMAVEGLRRLMDDGRWSLADDVVHEVSSLMRHRLRPDDLLGRFDDSRFLLLLRRVDSALASLIAAQLVDRLGRLAVAKVFPGGEIGVRCGVCGSGSPSAHSPPVEALIKDAVRLCHLARQQGIPVASDVEERHEGTKARRHEGEKERDGGTEGRRDEGRNEDGESDGVAAAPGGRGSRRAGEL